MPVGGDTGLRREIGTLIEIHYVTGYWSIWLELVEKKALDILDEVRDIEGLRQCQGPFNRI